MLTQHDLHAVDAGLQAGGHCTCSFGLPALHLGGGEGEHLGDAVWHVSRSRIQCMLTDAQPACACQCSAHHLSHTLHPHALSCDSLSSANLSALDSWVCRFSFSSTSARTLASIASCSASGEEEAWCNLASEMLRQALGKMVRLPSGMDSTAWIDDQDLPTSLPWTCSSWSVTPSSGGAPAVPSPVPEGVQAGVVLRACWAL